MMVATIPPPTSIWRSIQLSAITAMSWSPSITWALLVDNDDAVRVAIKRDADIGAHFLDLGGHGFGGGGAHLVVDVEAVGFDADGEDFGAQFPEGNGRDLVGGAVGAIEHDAQAGQVDVPGQGALGVFDVAGARFLVAMGAADLASAGEMLGEVAVDQALDLEFDFVGELEPVGTEQLDAIVLIGIVRGRDHHPEIGPQRAGQHGDGGRRHGAEEVDVHAHGGKAGGQGLLDHVAGAARILADHDAIAMVAAHELGAGRHAHLEREFGRQLVAIGEPANAVRAEIFPGHGDPPKLVRFDKYHFCRVITEAQARRKGHPAGDPSIDGLSFRAGAPCPALAVCRGASGRPCRPRARPWPWGRRSRCRRGARAACRP
jgi:hypothetical protein